MVHICRTFQMFIQRVFEPRFVQMWFSVIFTTCLRRNKKAVCVHLYSRSIRPISVSRCLRHMRHTACASIIKFTGSHWEGALHTADAMQCTYLSAATMLPAVAAWMLMIGSATWVWATRYSTPGLHRLIAALPALAAIHCVPLLFDYQRQPLAAMGATFLCVRLTSGKVGHHWMYISVTSDDSHISPSQHALL